jgi:hypothetical protein
LIPCGVAGWLAWVHHIAPRDGVLEAWNPHLCLHISCKGGIAVPYCRKATWEMVQESSRRMYGVACPLDEDRQSDPSYAVTVNHSYLADHALISGAKTPQAAQTVDASLPLLNGFCDGSPNDAIFLFPFVCANQTTSYETRLLS